MNTMKKAIVFDIDNTLTNDISWLKITELLGASVSKHQDIFYRFSRHELAYEKAKKQLIGLWQATGNSNRTHWEELIDDWPLKKDAAEVVDFAQKYGYKTALITGSFDLLAESVARKLHIPSWYANTTLEWDASGNLVDFEYVRDQAPQKLVHLQEFAAAAGIAVNNCVAVGDGDNDIEIFKATGLGIAVGSQNQALCEVSWRQIEELSEIIDILTNFKN